MTISVDLVARLEPSVADYPPGSTFGPREARSYQFVWLLRGSATWLWDDVALSLTPGKLLLIRPGMRDAFRWDPRTPTRHAYVHFTLTGAVAGGGARGRGCPGGPAPPPRPRRGSRPGCGGSWR
ncbi:hypothetical protein AB0392_50740, partial [Nonomuraea angiospora]|uniref:hypothetical protein n=1 Tax=Nonomuraea angiospora TaxID=46172 RepID=UPI00344CC29C